MSQFNTLGFPKCLSKNCLYFQMMVANYGYNTGNNEEISFCSLSKWRPFLKVMLSIWSEISSSCWNRETEVRSLMALQFDVLIVM